VKPHTFCLLAATILYAHGLTLKEISLAIGGSTAGLCSALKRSGMKPRRPGRAAGYRYDVVTKLLEPRDQQIRDMRLNERKSIRQIGKAFDMSGENVRQRLKRMGVPTRRLAWKATP
jgi:hypothetical protein